MHSTPDARFAVVCLLIAAAFAALARRGDQREVELAARALAVRADAGARSGGGLPEHGRARRAHGEGERLRDGAAMDVNRASAAELELLPGVGPHLAREIVRVREQEGAFASVRALRGVRGIGDKTFAKIAPFVRVGSEQLEHPAQPQRDVGGVPRGAVLEQDAGAHVETDGQVAGH